MREIAIEERRHGSLHYLVAGDGPVLLAFHGAVGNAESMSWFLSSFSGEFRVIAPSLGDTHDVDRFCDDVASLLDARLVDSVTLFGISFGGLLAQAFVARHGARVNRLILMSCGLPRRTAVLLYTLVGQLARVLPQRIVRGIVRLVLTRRLVSGEAAHPAVRRAIRSHRRRLDQFSRRVQKDIVVARFRLVTDIHRASDRIAGEMRTRAGDTLVLLAQDDPLLSASARAHLRLALPNARVHTFEAGGHLIPLVNGDEMRNVIAAFARH